MKKLRRVIFQPQQPSVFIMNSMSLLCAQILNLIVKKRVYLVHCAAVAFILVSHTAVAGIYSTIDKVESNWGEIKYTYTIRGWDYDDSSPNPCYKLAACTVAISHRHVNSGASGAIQTGWWGSKAPCVLSSRTIGELGICLRDTPSAFGSSLEGNESGVRLTIPYIGTTLHSGTTVTQECVGLFYSARTVSSGTQGLLMLPGSVCGIAPPPAGACKMADTLEINHGVLDASGVNGASAESILNIDCNKGLPAKIYLDNTEGIISLSADIKSVITANGENVKDGAKINLVQGANSIKIRSQLVTSSTSIGAGEFQGSGVLILTLQ